MTDRDNITLPREVAEHLTKMLEECPLIPNQDWSERDCVALNALRKALAAEQPKPEPVAVFDEQMGHPVLLLGSPMLKDKQPLYTAPPEDEALRRDAEQGRWLRDWLDNNGLLVRAIRGESLAGYEHPDIEALRRENERLRRVLLCLVEACTDEGVRCMDNLLALARAALRREET